MKLTSGQVKEALNISDYELSKMRKSGQIEYEPVSKTRFTYSINEELTKDFLKLKPNEKSYSTTTDKANVEYELNDESNLMFPQARSVYSQYKEAKKLNAFQQRDNLIRLFRQMSQKPKVANSIDEVVNEMISPFDDGRIVKCDFDDNTEMGDATKKAISESFDKCMSLLNFRDTADEIVRDWYIDGLLPLECVYDNQNTKEGIKDIVKMSPIYLRDIKDPHNQKNYFKYETYSTNHYNNVIIKDKETYKEEQVLYVGSGLWDVDKIYEISYLQPAMKAINDLSHIENSIIKYRITRASEKNVWNIDVGNMPKAKAENHLTSIARDISSDLRYNTITGETNLDATEGITSDWLFPSRNGKQKTEVNTINGNSDFISKLEDLEYFRRELYEALKIPVGRLDGDSSLDYSGTDILREEFKFVKFIAKLRKQFNKLFLGFIKRDLVIKKLIREDDWRDIYQDIELKWNQSNPIIENAELDNLQKRFEMVQELKQSDVVGTIVPLSFITDKILKMTDEEFNEMQKQIEKEKKKGFHAEPKEDEE